MKTTIPKYVGKAATKMFRATVIPIVLYSIYIIYLIVGIRSGTVEMTTADFNEVISSEIVSAVMMLGGTLIIDLEEKNSELNN